MRTTLIGMLLLAACVASGCGKSARSKRTHEAVVKDSIESMRIVSESMKGVHDADSAQRAAEIIRREADHLQKLKEELAAMGKASGGARDRARQHHQEITDGAQQITQATASLMGTSQAGQLPHEVATALSTASSQYGQAMIDFGNQAGRALD